MGYDLSSTSGKYHRWNALSWPGVLELAYMYGWKPQGTTMPYWEISRSDGTRDLEEERKYNQLRDEWDGSYFYNEHQIVSEADAHAMGEALKRALVDIPDHNCISEDWLFSPAKTDVYLSSYSEMKEYLKMFIDFCESGAFLIG